MVAIFVLLTFILFIVVDMLVLKAQKKKHPAFQGSSTIADLAVFTKEIFQAPLELFLSKGHTWAQKNEYGLIKVGIDEFILKALGKVALTKTAEAGQALKKGDILFEGTVNNKVLKFRSPIEGTVKFINPNILNKKIADPYGDDWGLLLAANNFTEDKKTLFTGNELKSFLNKEFSRLKDFLHAHTLRPELAGATMLDGGNVVEGAVSSITEKGIEEFEKDFLNF
jgi:glycine cleavage system H lipoate-binding protein